MTNIRVHHALLIILALLCAHDAKAYRNTLLKEVYAKVACTILSDAETGKITSLARKGEPLTIIQPTFCLLCDTASNNVYKVRLSDGTAGFVYAKYLTADKEDALKDYRADYYGPLHKRAKDTFGGGDPLGCDFYPRQKPVFENKAMPQCCYSLYIPCNAALLGRIDEFIELARQTRINTFVIDVKEDGAPGFKAEAMMEYCPSAYRRAADNEELYRKAVQKIHDEGMWAVGRIVCFKDCLITKDHPEYALWDKGTDKMLLHNKSNWPSAYCRKVWEYNVSLACEAVTKLGFDEINFDYVRFPDRISRIEDNIEMRNCYGESKVQAIQRFVTYAADQIHRTGAYVSIDVFGESANPGYTTAYGQYWPAISNVADVICGMPYPDHFADGYYGIRKPWNNPYAILNAWGRHVTERQQATPSPAVVRTWVQAYHVMKHVDPNGIDYDALNIEKEIRGLFDAGLTGGYITWLSSGNLNRYRSQAAAFNIDYYKEWLAAQSADK